MSQIRTGISGWTYAPWRGVFYPKKLPHERELEYASRQVGTIEINGTFYRLQRPSNYHRWYSATPDGFVFAVKGSRFITHMRRLLEPEPPLEKFFASGVLDLGEKLGPILWQLPPNMKFEVDRIARFLSALPRKAKGNRQVRYAMEPRHESFSDPRFTELLRERGIAFTISHSSGHWPMFEVMTADFVYIRLHGEGKLYSGGYGDRVLDDWASKIRRWSHPGRDVFVYFDNDVKVRAPADAIALAAKLSGHHGVRQAA